MSADPLLRSPAVKCPRCGKPVKWAVESEYKPFCSERCRLIDLGGWLSEKHVIPGGAEHVHQDDVGK